MKKSIYFSTDTAFIGVTTHQRQHNLKNIYIFNLQLVESEDAELTDMEDCMEDVGFRTKEWDKKIFKDNP